MLVGRFERLDKFCQKVLCGGLTDLPEVLVRFAQISDPFSVAGVSLRQLLFGSVDGSKRGLYLSLDGRLKDVLKGKPDLVFGLKPHSSTTTLRRAAMDETDACQWLRDAANRGRCVACLPDESGIESGSSETSTRHRCGRHLDSAHS